MSGNHMSDKLHNALICLSALVSRRESERGATATEYALLVALIAVILIGGVGAFGGALNSFFEGLQDTVAGW